MSTGKRLAKRSIIGTRVCAPGDDGKYYSGVISAVNTPSNGKHESANGALSITPQTRYQVRFDPVPASSAGHHSKVPDSKREFLDRDLIGPGFSSVCGARLLAGQKVFLTHNGREVQGSVIEHREHLDEVDVIISPNKQEGNVTLTKRIDEVRLLESRKSARLADTDTDFARLADMGSDRKRTASQATMDRHDNSNSPYHPNNNRSPNWKPRRRTQSEQSTDNSDNNVTETTTRKYKGNGGSTAYLDFSQDYDYPYTVYVDRSRQVTRYADNMMLSADDASAALVLMSLASPSKDNHVLDSFCCPQYKSLMGAIEETSSSGNSNASLSESDNSWRSDTSSPRCAEECYSAHQNSSSAPSSPKDEGIVPDLLYPHRLYSKKRRFINVNEAEDEDEDEQVVASRSSPKYISKPQQQQAATKAHARREVELVPTTTTSTATTTVTKAKRGRPPTYRPPPAAAAAAAVPTTTATTSTTTTTRARSPTPDRLAHEDAETAGGSDLEADNSNDLSNNEFVSNGYDHGGRYRCNWREGNNGPICGLKGDLRLVSRHVIECHLDGNEEENPDFYMVEDDESNADGDEAKPTECELPTKSHWDMVKPMSADPEYQLQIHRNQMAAHPAESMVNGGREIIYMESSGSLSPRENVAPRQTMSPPRPANKPIKAKALQQRQFIGNVNGGNGGGGAANISNNNHTSNHMTKVSLVHINLGKMQQTTRRGRSDVKKCRKVYGMSRKEMWCTQCRWKKACQRFHMPQPGGPTGNAANELSMNEQMTIR